MLKKFAKNSKKGLTLPMAIVISIVLVIVAAGLIFIALSSISTTDVSVNGRQAFMDVRSALDYAESYYRTQITNYAKIGDQKIDPTTNKKWREEYIVAAEDEVTVGASGKRTTVKYAIQNTYPDTEAVKTYVVVQYFPAVGKTPPKLRLTGYSHYSDTFGNKGKLVSLSVQFDVGSSGSQKRVTVVNTWKDPNTQSTTETITLHLKKPADLEWPGICYYIWTYNDVEGAYKDDNGKKVKYSYYKEDGSRFTPDIDKINIDEKTKIIEPNSSWNNDEKSDIKGPSGMLVTQGNGWSVGDYQINSNRVNYFNVIFANRSTLLKVNGVFDSQLNEIFHLWYLNEDDKNIYFEFLNKKKYNERAGKSYYTLYRTGRDWVNGNDPAGHDPSGPLQKVDPNNAEDSWDGLEGLDDTILVYLRNQKTTVHFRSYNDSNKLSADQAASKTAPLISVALSDGSAFKGPTFLTNSGKNEECGGSKQSSNIIMQYEGCGWWVANIETKKSFNATITYGGVTQSLANIRPFKQTSAPEEVPEVWIVLKPSSTLDGGIDKGKLEAHQTEKSALRSIGVEYGSYVTIHAKNYDPDISASPKLSYMNEIQESSTGRQRLYEKIMELNMLNPDDYKNYEDLFGDKDGGSTKGLRNKSIDVYNKGISFMKAPYGVDEPERTPSPSDTVDVELANTAYETYVTAIVENIGKLEPAVADKDTIANFISVYEAAKSIFESLVDYDSGYHDAFKNVYQSEFTSRSYSNYGQLYDQLKDAAQVTITKTELLAECETLDGAVTTINEHKLSSRVPLEELLQTIDSSSEYKDKTVYEEEYVNELVAKISPARDLVKKKSDGSYEKQTTNEYLGDTYDNLSNAFEELKKHKIPKNDLDFTELDEKIAAADQTIANAEAGGENYTDASKQALAQAVEQAGGLRENPDATQDNVKEAAKNIQKYIDRFTVYKPKNINDAVKAEGKKRIWLENQQGCTFRIYVKGSTGDFALLNDSRVQYEAGTQLSYVDLIKTTELEFRVTVSFGEDPAETAAADVVVADMTDDTVIYCADNTAKTITQKDLVTVFLGKKDADQKSISILSFGATDNKTKGYGTEENYSFVRFAVEKGKPFSEALYVNRAEEGLGGGGLTGENIITSVGEYVIIWTDNFKDASPWRGYKTIKVSDIYPKSVPETSGEPDTPPVGGTVAPVSEDYEIRSLANYEWAAQFQAINASDPIDDSHICILFDTQGWSEFSGKKPYIYAWTGGGNSSDTRNAEYKNKPEMKHYKDDLYYYICDSKFENIIITNGSGDDNESNGIKKVVNTTNLSRGKKYYVVRSGSKPGDTGYIVWASSKMEVTSGNELYDLIDIDVDTGKICIFFDMNGKPGVVPYIHYWGGAGGTTWGTLPQMFKFHNYDDYYYIIISNTHTGFLIAYDSKGNNKAVENNGEITSDNKYFIVKAKSDGKDYEISSYGTPPSVVVDEPETVAEESLVKGIEMAYVGGGKIRVKNKSYVDTYGSGKKWNSMVGGTRVSVSNNDDDNVATKVNGLVSSLSNDKMLVLMYKENSSDYADDSPYIYMWNSAGSKNESWENRPKMSYLGKIDGHHYFYIICDKKFTHYITTDKNGNKVLEDKVLDLDGSGNIYDVYIINGGNGNNDTKSSKTSFSVPSSWVSSVKNSVLASLTGADDKKCLSDSWKFGGFWGNHSSENRVGDSKLLPYYDWYEYKIPVNSSNLYTFEVWGLDPNQDSNKTKTPQIKKVYGDVWVSLYNDEGSTAKGKPYNSDTETDIKTFTHTELSTFDPEITLTAEKVSLYFKVPVSDASYTWQNPRIIKAHGTGDKNTSKIQQNIVMTSVKGGNDETKPGYGRNANIYRAEGISKNNPFIEFAIDRVKKSDGTPETLTYKVKMQGGKKILFNPAKGLDGDWEKYTSEYEYLEEICDKVLDMYYAKTIINQYNSKGEIVHQSDETKTQTSSSYLKGDVIEAYLKENGVSTVYFEKSGFDLNSTYKTSIDRKSIEATDASADKAYSDYLNLKEIVETYTTLYTKITGESRAYMNTPLSADYHGNEYHTQNADTSQYPEFINRGNYRTYNESDVGVLAGKVSSAEETYINGTYSGAAKGVAAARKAIEAIDRAIANMRVGVEGTIAVVLYDAQSKVENGYSFTVSYKDNFGVAHNNEPVDQVNIEGYPIKFIYNELTEQPYDYITDVQFSNSYTDKRTGALHTNEDTGPSLAEIKQNEVYVLMDYEKVDEEEAAFWRKNDLTDYRQMDSDEYIKDADVDDVVLKMKKEDGADEYETMTVYFRYDTLVKYGSESYTIKAGAYDFKDEDTTELTSPVYGGELKLFSENAKNYFKDPSNYGEYPSGVSGLSAGWTNGNTFSTAQQISTKGYVNLDVSNGAFTSLPLTRSYSYFAKEGIYFRWSSESDLEVGGGGVELHSNEIKFGAVGAVDASQYGSNNTHFKFYSFSGEDSMVVHFLTDVTVKYATNTGLTRSFVIREGKYMIRKVMNSELDGGNPDDDTPATDYIADLFNETYWKDGIHARPLNEGEDSSSSGGGSFGLSDKPTYSN